MDDEAGETVQQDHHGGDEDAAEQADIRIEHRVAGGRADGDHRHELEGADLSDAPLPDQAGEEQRAAIHDDRAEEDLALDEEALRLLPAEQDAKDLGSPFHRHSS